MLMGSVVSGVAQVGVVASINMDLGRQLLLQRGLPSGRASAVVARFRGRDIVHNDLIVDLVRANDHLSQALVGSMREVLVNGRVPLSN